MFHTVRRSLAMSGMQMRSCSGGAAGQSGIPGEGAGRGGGGGGSIREAGGAFGKMEAVHEDEYFYKLQRQQMTDLKKEESKNHKDSKDPKNTSKEK